MRKRIANHSETEMKRFYSIPEAADYLGLGISSTRAWCKQIGAERRFGGRTLYDIRVIDAALNGESINLRDIVKTGC